MASDAVAIVLGATAFLWDKAGGILPGESWGHDGRGPSLRATQTRQFYPARLAGLGHVPPLQFSSEDTTGGL